jgi:UDP-N-acetylmuramyl-tripeptide synthetase
MKELVKKMIPKFILDAHHQFWPFLGALAYGFPSRKLIVIGVTGTNGKTTVVDWTARVLEEAGYKIASASSVRFKIGEREKPNMLKMTMPGRMKLQKFLKDAVDGGCHYAVIEVTSEGIAQHRHSFIDFDVAVFTNLSSEHIERHGGFEKYKEAKGKLFGTLKPQNTNHKTQTTNHTQKKVSIVNFDDENAEYFLRLGADEKFGFTTNEKLQVKNLYCGKNIVSSRESVEFKVENIAFHLNVAGEFNIYNALAAICVGLSQGVDLATSARALGKVQGVPGRMEIVVRDPFTVVVDYAHTPVALENVYRVFAQPKSDIFINKESPSYVGRPKLICVLGAAGGGRDKWKRQEFGRIAARYCDAMILTNEDPYDEDPRRILFEMKSGIPNSEIPISGFYEILDRKEAIRKALVLAKKEDVVVITGKGSEPWMCVAKGRKIPWSDREVVKEELRKLVTRNS